MGSRRLLVASTFLLFLFSRLDLFCFAISDCRDDDAAESLPVSPPRRHSRALQLIPVPRSRPVITSVNPKVLVPLGGLVTLNGTNFPVGTNVTITVHGQPCDDPLVPSDTTATCVVGPGTGSGLNIVMTNTNTGLSSAPKRFVSYKIPVVKSVSKTWGVSGTTLNVTAYHLGKALERVRCRIGDTGPGVIPRSDMPLQGLLDIQTVTCDVPPGAPPGVQAVQMSNDAGVRWGTACIVQTEPYWPDGKRPSDGTYVEDPLVMEIVLLVEHRMLHGDQGPAFRRAFDGAIGEVNEGARLGAGSRLVGKIRTFTTPREAGAIATELSNNNSTSNALVGVVGGMVSVNTLRIAAELSKVLVPFAVVEASLAELSDPIKYPSVLRLDRSTKQQATEIVALLRRMSWDQSLAVLVSDDIFSTELGELVAKLFAGEVGLADDGPRKQGRTWNNGTTTTARRRGGQVVYHSVFPTYLGSRDLSPAQVIDAVRPHAEKIAAAKPQAIFVEGILRPSIEAVFKALNMTGILDNAGIVSNYLGNDFGVAPPGTFVVATTGSKYSQTNYCSRRVCFDNRQAATIFDSVHIIARGIEGEMAKNKGAAFFRGSPDARRNARRKSIRAMKNNRIDTDVAATGTIQFVDGSNDRLFNQGEDAFQIFNVHRELDQATGRRAVVLVGSVASRTVTFTGGAIEFPGERIGKRVVSAPAFVRILLVSQTKRTDLVAARVAARVINKDPNLLPFSRLVVEVHHIQKTDGKFDPAGAAGAARKLRASGGGNYTAMLACCSSVARALLTAPQEEVFRAPKIGFWAMADNFESSHIYPKFVRTVFSTSQLGEAILQTFLRLGWRRVFLIVDTVTSAQQQRDAFLQLCKSSPVPITVDFATVDFRGASIPTRDAQLASAVRHAFRDNYTILYPMPDYEQDFQLTVQAALDSKLRERWQFVSAFYNQASKIFSDFMITNKTVQDAYDGMIEVTLPQIDRRTAVAKIGAVSWKEAYEGKEFSEPMIDAHSGLALSTWNGILSESNQNFMENLNQNAIAPFVYDAVLLGGHAAASCDVEPGCNVENSDDMMRHLRMIEIEGLSNSNLKIIPGSNNVGGLGFMIGSFNKNAGALKNIGTAVVPAAEVRVCQSGKSGDLEKFVGETCEYKLTRPVYTYAGPKNENTLRLAWNKMPLHGGFLKHYAIQATVYTVCRGSDCQTSQTIRTAWPEDAVAVIVPSECLWVDFSNIPVDGHAPGAAAGDATGNATAGLCTVDAKRPSVERGKMYVFELTAVYAELSTEVASTDNVAHIEDTTGRHVCLPERGQNETCQCNKDQFHSAGLPGEPAESWHCRPCPKGVSCWGRTFVDIVAEEGWFVAGEETVSMSTKNDLSVAALPRLYPCPGRSMACPGGSLVAASMVHGGGDDADKYSRFLRNLTTQCSHGYTGMLCRACEERFFMTELSCSKCSMDPDDALELIAIVLLVTTALLLVATIVLGRVTRRPYVEKKFVADILTRSNFNASSGTSAIETILNTFDMRGVEKGASRTAFDHGLSKLGSAPYTHTEATWLWERLDEDHNGEVTEREFVSFFNQLQNGKSSNRCGETAMQLVSWWFTDRCRTMRIVLITLFQINSSISISFPREGAAIFNDANNGNRTNVLEDAKEAALPFFNLIGNINVNIFEFVRCVIGPRHIDRMAAAAYTMVIPALLVFFVVFAARGFQKLVSRCSDAVTDFAAQLTTTVSVSKAIMFSFEIVFFCYPRATAVILRSFVCTSYDVGGRKTSWMEDDPSVQCDPEGPAYSTVWTYAIVLVITIIIGVPVIQFITLARWRFPYNRLYEATELGDIVPSKIIVLGSFYRVYRPSIWWMASLDTIIKLTLTGLLGLLFQGEHKSEGLAVAALLCIAISVFYATVAPFAYHNGNRLAVLSYVGLAAAYIARVLERELNATGRHASTFSMFEHLLGFAAVLMGVFIMLYGGGGRLQDGRAAVARLAPKCLKMRRRRVRTMHHVDAVAVDNARARCFDRLLMDLEPLARRALRHAQRHHTYATSARQSVDMSEVRQACTAFEAAIKVLVEELQTPPLKVTWQQLLNAEEKARELSVIVFGGSKHVHTGTKKRLSRVKESARIRNTSRLIDLSFANSHTLWETNVVQQLYNQEEGGGGGRGGKEGDGDTDEPPMYVMTACHHTIIALLQPGADFGKFKLVRLCRDRSRALPRPYTRLFQEETKTQPERKFSFQRELESSLYGEVGRDQAHQGVEVGHGTHEPNHDGHQTRGQGVFNPPPGSVDVGVEPVAEVAEQVPVPAAVAAGEPEHHLVLGDGEERDQHVHVV